MIVPNSTNNIKLHPQLKECTSRSAPSHCMQPPILPSIREFYRLSRITSYMLWANEPLPIHPRGHYTCLFHDVTLSYDKNDLSSSFQRHTIDTHCTLNMEEKGIYILMFSLVDFEIWRDRTSEGHNNNVKSVQLFYSYTLHEFS